MHMCRYEILQCGDVEKLIRKRADQGESPKYYVHTDEIFDVIKRAHIQTGHGGRDKMLKTLVSKYANITCDAVNLYKEFSISTKKRKRPTTKGVVVHPIVTNDLVLDRKLI